MEIEIINKKDVDLHECKNKEEVKLPLMKIKFESGVDVMGYYCIVCGYAHITLPDLAEFAINLAKKMEEKEQEKIME